MPRQSTSKSRHFWFTTEFNGAWVKGRMWRQIQNVRFGCPSQVFYFQLFCRSEEAIFRAQGFRWDSTVDKFLFLVTMSSTSSDSEMTFDSEDSEIYYIAEDTGREVGFKTMTTKLIYWLVFCDLLLTTQPPSLWLT